MFLELKCYGSVCSVALCVGTVMSCVCWNSHEFLHAPVFVFHSFCKLEARKDHTQYQLTTFYTFTKVSVFDF